MTFFNLVFFFKIQYVYLSVWFTFLFLLSFFFFSFLFSSNRRNIYIVDSILSKVTVGRAARCLVDFPMVFAVEQQVRQVSASFFSRGFFRWISLFLAMTATRRTMRPLPAAATKPLDEAFLVKGGSTVLLLRISSPRPVDFLLLLLAQADRPAVLPLVTPSDDRTRWATVGPMMSVTINRNRGTKTRLVAKSPTAFLGQHDVPAAEAALPSRRSSRLVGELGVSTVYLLRVSTQRPVDAPWLVLARADMSAVLSLVVTPSDGRSSWGTAGPRVSMTTTGTHGTKTQLAAANRPTALLVRYVAPAAARPRRHRSRMVGEQGVSTDLLL
jgi:hypothetical protein